MRASLLTGLACLVSLAVAAKAVDPRDCEGAQLTASVAPPVPAAELRAPTELQLDSRVTPEQRKTVEGIESVMQTYCDVAKGKEKTMVRCCPCRCAMPLFCPEVAKRSGPTYQARPAWS
eukprot:scaffold30733_cov129-Isochrysis_galbana.AAC.7